jgi:hypothetical protein
MVIVTCHPLRGFELSGLVILGLRSCFAPPQATNCRHYVAIQMLFCDLLQCRILKNLWVMTRAEPGNEGTVYIPTEERGNECLGEGGEQARSLRWFAEARRAPLGDLRGPLLQGPCGVLPFSPAVCADLV